MPTLPNDSTLRTKVATGPELGTALRAPSGNTGRAPLSLLDPVGAEVRAQIDAATAAINVPPAPAKPWAGPYADEERMSQRWGMGGRPSDWRGD